MASLAAEQTDDSASACGWLSAGSVMVSPNAKYQSRLNAPFERVSNFCKFVTSTTRLYLTLLGHGAWFEAEMVRSNTRHRNQSGMVNFAARTG